LPGVVRRGEGACDNLSIVILNKRNIVFNNSNEHSGDFD